MTIHSPRFLLACCRFSEEKNKVHLKKKEGNFVRVFPLPMLKKKWMQLQSHVFWGELETECFLWSTILLRCQVITVHSLMWRDRQGWRCGEESRAQNNVKALVLFHLFKNGYANPESFLTCCVKGSSSILCGPWDGLLRNQYFWVYPPDSKTFIS